MFGFLTRKPTFPFSVSSTSLAPSPGPVPSKQLRTPSPSVHSLTHASPSHHTHNPPTIKFESPAPVDSEAPPPTPSPPPQILVTDPKPLRDLVANIPAKILHEYVLGQLSSDDTPPATLTTLTSFFAHLAPPSKLHCLRCHKGFFEIENDDRSCLVPHDDESAEVERVSTDKAKKLGAVHETLWGCCGKTTEGSGDMGPPDGWCYEGRHTTDPKRARFRADSTPQDDKLTTCKRCPTTPLSLARGRSPRKRSRGDASPSRSTSSSSSEVEQTTKTRRRQSSKKPRTRKPRAEDARETPALPAAPPTPDIRPDDMDIDASSPPAVIPKKVRPKPKPRAKSLAAKTRSTPPPTAAAFPSPPKSSPRHHLTRSSAPRTSPEIGSPSRVLYIGQEPSITRQGSRSSLKSAPQSTRVTRRTRTLAEVVDTSVDWERGVGVPR
ncbi:hypothetical protein BD779DRAFT_1532430 [Infundibulicybe gibba]|nr:hypothetical protein BD779DRAFT_1532430 [Infundibulicybe gibba]